MQYPTIRLHQREPEVGGNATYELSRALTVIGTGDGCDITVSSGKVEGAHTVLVRLGGGVYVCDLGATGGTRVNGAFVRWSRLEDGDELAIGSHRYEIGIAEAADAIMTMVRRFCLRDPHTIGEVFSEDPVLLIGSDAACDVVLGERAIAPRHALVAWTCDGPMVRDLRGRQSVRVGGRWVNDSPIASGETIGVGVCELVFETEASSSATALGGGRTASNWRLSAASSEASSDAAQMIAGTVPDGRRADRSSANGGAGYEHLDDDEATRELVRTIEALDASELPAGSSRSMDQDRAEELDDSDVLELLEEVDEFNEGASSPTSSLGGDPIRSGGTVSRKEFEVSDETLRAETCTSGRSSASIRAERLIHENEGELQSCAPDLRARVIAAQQALDERARKLREELDEERQRLRACQDQLQGQARRLLDAARSTRTRATNAPSVDDEESLYDLDAALESVSEGTNGHGSSPVDGRKDWPGRSHAAGRGSSDAEQASLQTQVGELAKLVRVEREEMRESESRLETLKFEIERLRDEVVRSREKHQLQQAEHDARHQALARALSTLANERESLLARLRRLESKEMALTARLTESERVKQGLTHESERLLRLQELHDERLREFRITLEGERHRLRLRQADMQRKAGELARIARTRRNAIEAIVAEQQKNLKAEETKLRTKRSAVVEAGRAELERTATELEQVLSVRLADVEAELLTRQETLDAWIRAIHDSSRPTADAGRSGSGRTATGIGSGISSSRVTPEASSAASIGASDVRHLAQLESELEGLHRAVLRLDDDPERRVTHFESDQDVGNSESWSSRSREARWSGGGKSLTSKLNEKISTLRSGIEEIGRTVGSGASKTPYSESTKI